MGQMRCRMSRLGLRRQKNRSRDADVVAALGWCCTERQASLFLDGLLLGNPWSVNNC